MNNLINKIKTNTFESNKLKFKNNFDIKELFDALKTNFSIIFLFKF